MPPGCWLVASCTRASTALEPAAASWMLVSLLLQMLHMARTAAPRAPGSWLPLASCTRDVTAPALAARCWMPASLPAQIWASARPACHCTPGCWLLLRRCARGSTAPAARCWTPALQLAQMLARAAAARPGCWPPCTRRVSSQAEGGSGWRRWPRGASLRLEQRWPVVAASLLLLDLRLVAFGVEHMSG
jgi:hypothetical protein